MRKWDVNKDSVKRKCTDEVIAELQNLGLENAGIIAASDIVDIVVENLAPDIYNKGIADARKLVEERLTDVDVDLSLLLDQQNK